MYLQHPTGEQIPRDVFFEIILFLSNKELGQFAQCSKMLNKLCWSPDFWKRKCLLDFSLQLDDDYLNAYKRVSKIPVYFVETSFMASSIDYNPYRYIFINNLLDNYSEKVKALLGTYRLVYFTDMDDNLKWFTIIEDREILTYGQIIQNPKIPLIANIVTKGGILDWIFKDLKTIADPSQLENRLRQRIDVYIHPQLHFAYIGRWKFHN